MYDLHVSSAGDIFSGEGGNFWNSKVYRSIKKIKKNGKAGCVFQRKFFKMGTFFQPKWFLKVAEGFKAWAISLSQTKIEEPTLVY